MLSVIVPVYNSEQTLFQCLNSIVNQSFKDIEIIVVDDGSKDSSKSIVSQFMKKHKNIIVYIGLKENCGIGNARNIGLKNAKGDYITFVDADDWVDSNLYKNAIKAMKNNEAEIAIYGIKNEYENYICSTVRYKYHSNLIDNDAALRLLCRTYSNDTYISPIVNHKIYKSDFLKDANLIFDTHSYYYDDEFTFLLFLNTCKIVLVNDEFYHYYQKTTSIMHTFSKRHIYDKIFTFKNIYDNLVQRQLYTKYYKDFWSFFDKSIRTVFDTLFSVEPNSETQRKYIKYFLEEFCKKFNYKDYIDYLDITRIKSLLLL